MSDIIRNIILFLLVGAVLLVGILYVMSEINSPGVASHVGLGSLTSLQVRL